MAPKDKDYMDMPRQRKVGSYKHSLKREDINVDQYNTVTNDRYIISINTCIYSKPINISIILRINK